MNRVDVVAVNTIFVLRLSNTGRTVGRADSRLNGCSVGLMLLDTFVSRSVQLRSSYTNGVSICTANLYKLGIRQCTKREQYVRYVLKRGDHTHTLAVARKPAATHTYTRMTEYVPLLTKIPRQIIRMRPQKRVCTRARRPLVQGKAPGAEENQIFALGSTMENAT